MAVKFTEAPAHIVLVAGDKVGFAVKSGLTVKLIVFDKAALHDPLVTRARYIGVPAGGVPLNVAAVAPETAFQEPPLSVEICH